MILPPNLTRTILAITTSAVANTATSGGMILAGGSGTRHRVWAFWATPTNTAQAAVNWKAWIQDHNGGIPVLGVSSPNFGSPGMQWIPGGSPITGNAAVDWAVQSALASLGLELVLYSILEAS